MVTETRKQYEEPGQRFGDLIGMGRKRTLEETRLVDLLGVLIQDYDRRPLDDSTPSECGFRGMAISVPELMSITIPK